MAHELEINDQGEASFVFNQRNGMPWHRLGTPVDGNGSAAEMLALAKADYTVQLKPVYTLDEFTGEPVLVEDRFATGRLDPHANGIPTFQSWEVVKGRYAVVQNDIVLDKALQVVGASHGDAVIDTLGVLNEGRRFFATIALEDLYIDPQGVNDKICRNLVVETSHDGTTPIRYVNTDVRAVCANTVRMALDMAQSVFTTRHTTNVAGRLDEAAEVLGMSAQWAAEFRFMAETMLGIEVPQGSGRIDRVLNGIWPESEADTDRKKRNREGRIEDIRFRFENNRNAGGYGYNGWSLFQAVGEHLDHGRGRSLKQHAEESMSIDNTVYKTKLAAQEAVLSLV